MVLVTPFVAPPSLEATALSELLGFSERSMAVVPGKISVVLPSLTRLVSVSS